MCSMRRNTVVVNCTVSGFQGFPNRSWNPMFKVMSQQPWLRTPIKGLLLDCHGVLCDGGDSGYKPVPGSLEAMEKLRKSGLPFLICSNETQNTTKGMVARMKGLGFQMEESEVLLPAPAARILLKERNLRPHLLIHPDGMPDFEEVPTENPNAVLLGDAGESFDYKALNDAFRILMSLEDPVLLTMGYGKYYNSTDGLKLDVGCFAKALEHACDIKAEVVGKPSKTFYGAAISALGLPPSEIVMIGDDILSDVGGAQKCGLRGVQVRTGKWQPGWENHPTVKPDGIIDNLLEGINALLAQ